MRLALLLIFLMALPLAAAEEKVEKEGKKEERKEFGGGFSIIPPAGYDYGAEPYTQNPSMFMHHTDKIQAVLTIYVASESDVQRKQKFYDADAIKPELFWAHQHWYGWPPEVTEKKIQLNGKPVTLQHIRSKDGPGQTPIKEHQEMMVILERLNAENFLVVKVHIRTWVPDDKQAMEEVRQAADAIIKSIPTLQFDWK